MPNRGLDTRFIETLKHQECQTQEGEDAFSREGEEQVAEGQSSRNVMKNMAHSETPEKLITSRVPCPLRRPVA